MKKVSTDRYGLLDEKLSNLIDSFRRKASKKAESILVDAHNEGIPVYPPVSVDSLTILMMAKEINRLKTSESSAIALLAKSGIYEVRSVENGIVLPFLK